MATTTTTTTGVHAAELSAEDLELEQAWAELQQLAAEVASEMAALPIAGGLGELAAAAAAEIRAEGDAAHAAGLAIAADMRACIAAEFELEA